MHTLVTYECNRCGHHGEYVELPAALLEHCDGGQLKEVARRIERLTLDEEGRLAVERDVLARRLRAGRMVAPRERRYPVRVTSAWSQRVGDRWEAVIHAGDNFLAHFVLPDEAKAKQVATLLQDAPVTEAMVHSWRPAVET